MRQRRALGHADRDLDDARLLQDRSRQVLGEGFKQPKGFPFQNPPSERLDLDVVDRVPGQSVGPGRPAGIGRQLEVERELGPELTLGG